MSERSAIPYQSQMIALPSGRFHYLSWGAERTELPSAVLLHGITSSALSWIRVGPALADRYRVYALDMRGHGASAKPASGAYSLRQTAGDALAFVEALALEKPVLMGHSWGGSTALLAAQIASLAETGPAFSQVVLEDPAPRLGFLDAAERVVSYTRDIGRPPEELRSEITADNPGWTEADIEGKIAALQQVSKEAVESVFAQSAEEGFLLPLLADIAAPVLLLRADPRFGALLDASIWAQVPQWLSTRSRAVQIDDSTHNIHRSQFEAFMQAVNAFLATDCSIA